MIRPEKKNGKPDPPEPTHAPVVVMDIGNTSISVGLWSGHAVSEHKVFPQDANGWQEHLSTLAGAAADGMLGGVVIASVAPDTLKQVCAWVEKKLNLEPLVVGRQVPLPIGVKLPDPRAVGTDRICCAAAAYEIKKTACVVVDFGTAVTIDVVDEEGAFVGGAIMPGLSLQAKSLHEHTAALPEVTPEVPKDSIGLNTADAILSGLIYGTAGAVRGVIEAFATHLGSWPVAVATGGDAEMICTEYCRIFDAVIPDLCLMGVGLAYTRRMNDAVAL